MNVCPACKHEVDEIDGVCPECGEILSVDEDKMDELVKAASIPNLGALFQKAKDAGLIKSGGTEYGSAT